MLHLLIKSLTVPLAASIFLMLIAGSHNYSKSQVITGEPIKLPPPDTNGTVPLETTLQKRRSTRTLMNETVSLEALGQLLWAAQGVTDKRGYRTAPSAGALYPLDIYVIVGNVETLTDGIYQYLPQDHSVSLFMAGDYREILCRASLGQGVIRQAPAVFVITGTEEKTTGKYGKRGVRYMYIEAGHAAQNICLQAVALGLGSVTIGAFTDREVAKILKIKINEEPLYIIPVGRSEK